jgi:TIR domain
MRQPRLFISYSLADQSFTKTLAEYLHRAYDEVWFDANRYGGEVWWEDVLWNIKASDIFIYLLSPSSVSATYCRAEYAEAQRLRKQVLPVIIRAHTHIPPELIDLQPVDMSQGLTSTKVGELLAALKQLEKLFPKAPPVPSGMEATPAPAVVSGSPMWHPRRILLALAFLVALMALVVLTFVLSIDPASIPPRTATGTDTQPAPTDRSLPSMPTADPLFITVVPSGDTPSASATVTSTDTPSPTIPTSTSTVPPTVTRRYTATSGG